MRIIFLNSWLGKIGKPYIDFIEAQKNSTDAFCLIEVDGKLFEELKNILPNFKGVQSIKYIGENERYEIAVFVKKKYEIVGFRKNIIKDLSRGDCLVTEITFNKSKVVLCAVHGVAQPGDKLDSKERITQSLEILNSVKDYAVPKIIGGDFNLFPDTKSIKMFEECGYVDLISKFEISTTRNKLALEQAKKQVKEGIPFVPSFFFALFITLIWGNLLFYLF